MKLRVIMEIEFSDPDQWHTPPRLLAREISMWILSKLGIGPGAKNSLELKDAKIIQTQLVVGPRHVTPLEGQVASIVEDITKKIDTDK